MTRGSSGDTFFRFVMPVILFAFVAIDASGHTWLVAFSWALAALSLVRLVFFLRRPGRSVTRGDDTSPS